MPKPRRRKPKRPETMQRNAVISSFTPSMRLGVRAPKDAEPEIEGRPWLELRGTLVEPIRDVQNVGSSCGPTTKSASASHGQQQWATSMTFGR